MELYVCGDGDLLDDLKKEVKIKGLEEKIIFFGYVKPVDLSELIKNAYLGYLLLENISLSYYYSLANKFFDYMHAGIPQITIDFPEYSLINSQHKVAELIDLDVEQIVNATNRLLNDQEYYNSMVENTIKAKVLYNWQLEKKRLIEFYKQIK